MQYDTLEWTLEQGKKNYNSGKTGEMWIKFLA